MGRAIHGVVNEADHDAIHRLCGQSGLTVTGVLQALASRATEALRVDPDAGDLAALFPEHPDLGNVLAGEARQVDMARKRRSDRVR